MQALQTNRASELETPLLERFVERCPEDWSRLGEQDTRALIRATILAGVPRRVVSEDALELLREGRSLDLAGTTTTLGFDLLCAKRGPKPGVSLDARSGKLLGSLRCF